MVISLLKQSQTSRSILSDGSRSLRLFWTEKLCLIAVKYDTVASFSEVMSLALNKQLVNSEYHIVLNPKFY